MSHCVTIMPQAVSDFDNCFDYIAERSARGASALREAFIKAQESLAAEPLSHGLAPESADHPFEIRQIFFRTRRGRNYRALYTVTNQDVFILHVRGPGQDLLSSDELQLP